MKVGNFFVFTYIYVLVLLFSLITSTIVKIIDLPTEMKIQETMKGIAITRKELSNEMTEKVHISQIDKNKEFVTEYDVFRDNMTHYERILYVQRNYQLFDTEKRRKLSDSILSSINMQKNNMVRNVVFQEMHETGLGNSMLALASSYMVSRLLNASYHVFWPLYSMSFDSPLIDINSRIGCIDGYTPSPIDNTKEPNYTRWKIRWSGCSPRLNALETSPLDVLVPDQNLVITAYYDYTNQLFKSGRYDQALRDNGLIPLNPSLPSPSIERVFNTEFSIMTAVRLFFQPKSFLKKHINSFLSLYHPYHLIGLQIRMGSGGADFRDTHKFLRMSSLQQFVQYAEDYRLYQGYKEDEVKWFLSTDSSEVERNLTASFPGRVIVASAYSRGHSAQQKANINAFNRAVIDVSILSHCEYMVLTNHSSFGMVARMIAPNPVFAIVPAIGY